MSETASPARTAEQHGHEVHGPAIYWKILGILAVLTVVEVGMAQVPMSRLLLGLILVPMSLAKIILIAGFFMHLKFDNRRLGSSWAARSLSPHCCSSRL